jgi:hypothetical protein
MSNTIGKSREYARDSGGASPPRESPVIRNNTGRVKFDDRGNAVWEWAVNTGRFGPDETSALLERLELAALSLADDSAPQPAAVTRKPQHAMGYCPYDSGKLGAAAVEAKRSGKKDLRRLGEWLKLREQVARNKQAED